MLFTNRLHCLVFVEHNVQSSLVSSIYMSPELGTNHNKGELQNSLHTIKKKTKRIQMKIADDRNLYRMQ